MTLIKSVSGVRGTIGGAPGINLTPIDIVEFTAAYGSWLTASHQAPTVVVGRDGRMSGSHVQNLVMETLTACGVNVIDIGLSTTPTVEMYVPKSEAQGGIVITASHNPKQWNALKFLNDKGEFISAEIGAELIEAVNQRSFRFVDIDSRGSRLAAGDAIAYHIEKILELDAVDVEAIQDEGFHVVVDCINSTGAIAIPPLLDALDCSYTLINSEVSGKFAHNPEPLAAHLSDLMQTVVQEQAALGIAVDPDVDRLAFVSEDGSYFGEEYTLVAISDYLLEMTPGNTVSNLSSTGALRDVTLKHGGRYSASPVGEVHVVNEMKRSDAIIGGEGNGGVIYPELHYGRDAMVGIALILSQMASTGKSMTELRASYPDYYIAKIKVQLDGLDPEQTLEAIKQQYSDSETDTRDGVKILLNKEWIHLRKSNTEPILRIYAESDSEAGAMALAEQVKEKIEQL